MSMTARVGVVSVALIVAACSGGGTSRPVGPKAAHTKDAGVAPAKKVTPSSQNKAIAFPDCAAHPCVLHRGTARYHRCLLASDGKCAHFGTVCNPSDTCMYDTGRKRYRKCKSLGLGKCESFSGPCSPKSTCQIDPKDGLYRACLEARVGVCARFGDLCQPR